jgi:cyclopropane fatty-acyl-phospholipid synthase-like methyltransferase
VKGIAMETPAPAWQEDESQFFIEYGGVITPSRDEQMGLVASLVPAEPDEPFMAVDLACGAGLLSRTLLERYPRCHVIALDFSPRMLQESKQNLAAYGSRAEVRQFDLKVAHWLETLPAQVRAFVSSLAIHHLDGAEKRALFRTLVPRLEPGGALLIADLVEPVNRCASRTYAAAWDDAVREQSLRQTGESTAYEWFRDRGWNHYVTPDVEFDKPSGLFEQLQWLREAGFDEIDCFWLRAGHAIYGGYTRAS